MLIQELHNRFQLNILNLQLQLNKRRLSFQLHSQIILLKVNWVVLRKQKHFFQVLLQFWVVFIWVAGFFGDYHGEEFGLGLFGLWVDDCMSDYVEKRQF